MSSHHTNQIKFLKKKKNITLPLPLPPLRLAREAIVSTTTVVFLFGTGIDT